MTTAAKTAAEREGEVRTFALLLQGLEDGQTLTDMTEALRELVQKIGRVAEATGKAKAELTLKLKIAGDQGGTVYIDTEIKTKEPVAPRARTVCWVMKDGTLSQENPKQTKLPLRSVEAPAAARDVGAPKGETRSV